MNAVVVKNETVEHHTILARGAALPGNLLRATYSQILDEQHAVATLVVN